MTPVYAELAVTTNFSFLRGASHPEDYVAEAARLNLAGIGIADRNTLSGVVRAHVALKETDAAESGLKLAIGCRLVFADDYHDFDSIEQTLRCVLNEQVIIEEVGFAVFDGIGDKYVGIISINEPATKDEVQELVQKHQITLMDKV